MHTQSILSELKTSSTLQLQHTMQRIVQRVMQHLMSTALAWQRRIAESIRHRLTKS